MVVYKITNLIDGKIYVGKTTGNAIKRFERHCRLSSRCPKLCAAIQKYGKENFAMEIIEQCSTMADLNNREIYWIGQLKSIEYGYNLTLGGDGGCLSEETKQKIRLLSLGRKASTKTKQKMSIERSGHKNSRAKAVIVFDGNVEIKFECLKYAAKHYDIPYSAARSIAQGKNKQSRSGLIFKYIEGNHE